MPVDLEDFNIWAKTVDKPSLHEYLAQKIKSSAMKENAEIRWKSG